MQNTSFRKIKSPLYMSRYSSEEILYFTLKDILPAEHVLALNPLLGTLSLLAYLQNKPRMISEQQFTRNEICLLLPLLETYPHYCPHELLLANFYNWSTTEKPVMEYKERVENSLEKGTWDQELRPIRNVLSRARTKLRTFGIEISSVHETGYSLIRSVQTAENDA